MRPPLRLLLAIAVALGGGACASFAPVVEEPLRVGNVADLDPAAIGLVPSVTTLQEARASVARHRLSGLVEVEYASAGGAVITVLGADYQRRLHVFENGRYTHSVQLPTAGVPPYGLALGLGDHRAAEVLIVLYRDPLQRADEPPRLLAFQLARGRFELFGRASFEHLVAEHGGMTRPALIGHDLEDGIMLVARDRDGRLWDTTYLLRIDEDAVTVQPKSITDALQCSCVRKYVFDQAAR